MKKNWLLLPVFTLLFLHCNTNDGPSPIVATRLDCTETPDVCTLAEANSTAGFQIFKAIHEEEPDKNIFISPLSISTALSMALNGADGQTRTDMQETLAYQNLDVPSLNEAYQVLLNALPQLDASVQMEIANALYHDQGFPIHDEYLTLNQDYYSSEIQGLDFKDPASVEVINDWVSAHTKGKIEEIIQEIPPLTVLYLINAIYFKGDWRFQFKEDQTTSQPFELADNSTVEVDMMRYEEAVNLPYFQNDLFQAVDLPYGDSVYSMTILLPNPNVALDEVIDNLTTANWESWTSQFQSRKLLFSMPKFKLEYEKILNDILIDLGMSIAFDDSKANFSKITDEPLWISLVKHKSFVEVNEKGTEAAAVTIVGFETTSVGPSMFVNRPFLFIIRENQANNIAFIGKMMNPGEG